MALAGFAAGCDGSDSGAAARARRGPPAGGAAPAAQVIAHTYLPRPERENYWEPVVLAPGEPHFLLQIHPRLKTPAEGPWTLRVKNAAGEPVVTLPGMRVDVATGAITLLCESSRFAKGDWTVELDLDEGGVTSGESRYVFRFRVG